MKEKLFANGKLKRTLCLMLALSMVLVLAPISGMVAHAEGSKFYITYNNDDSYNMGHVQAAKSAKAGDEIWINNTSSPLVLDIKITSLTHLVGGESCGGEWEVGLSTTPPDSSMRVCTIPEGYKVDDIVPNGREITISIKKDTPAPEPTPEPAPADDKPAEKKPAPKTGESDNMPFAMLILGLGVVTLGLASRKYTAK